jgi:hypothetical protein
MWIGASMEEKQVINLFMHLNLRYGINMVLPVKVILKHIITIETGFIS